MRGRCAAAYYVRSHEAFMTQKRTTDGALVPHVVVWECLRCGRPIGETRIWPPSPSTQASPSRFARAWHELITSALAWVK